MGSLQLDSEDRVLPFTMVQRTKALELLSRVLLKVVPVLLHNKNRMIETFAILDDIAERTMLLPTAV